MHKNKQKPTVNSDVGASSFEIWTANLAQLLTLGTLTNMQSFIFGDSDWTFCEVSYLVGTLKYLHSDADISDLGYLFCAFIWVGKNLNLLDIQEQCIHKLGKKYKVSWNLYSVFIIDLFKVVYWDPLTQLLPFTWDFLAKGQQLVWVRVCIIKKIRTFDDVFWSNA